jgi:SAM-dependent methyltransferase
MRTTNKCLICDGNSLRSHMAVFAPFIAKRIWGREPFPIRIKKCRRCNFYFADTRFEQGEENRLYADYRGPEYQSIRQSCEPWYTAKFNARLSTGTMEKRRAPIANILRQHLPSELKAVLDFGGDRGDLFAGLVPGASTYVYDISGNAAAPGVTALCSLDECAEKKFDLIGCSNVLEHVSYPRELLADIKRIARHRTLVFIEVSSETPFGLRNYAKRGAQELILVATRRRVAASLLPFGFLRQVHEHVNFFSLHSLKKLMQTEGFAVLAAGTYPSEGYSFGPYKIAAGQMAWTLSSLWTHPAKENI